MARWKFSPLRLGVWGMLAIVLVGVGRCGRERENPVDPNFPGGEALNPPGNIRAQGDIGRILLTWDVVKIDDLAGYGVWRATSATGEYTRLRGESNDANVTTGRTVFVDSTMDVSASKVYFYRVNTVDVNGQSSERSAFVSAEVREDKRPPGSPSNLSAVRDGKAGHVALVWNAPKVDEGDQDLTGLDGYRVFRARDTEDAYVQIATVPAGQTTYTDTTRLETDVRYFYQISAIDRFDNESARSRSASVNTLETVIAAPGGLRSISKVGKIELHWNPSDEENLLGYLVLRSTSTQAPFEPVSSNTPFTTAQTVYIDTDVKVDVVYFYRVQAVVQDPEFGILVGEASPFIDGHAEVDEAPPTAPTDLSVSLDDEDAGVVLLSWAPPTKDNGGGDLTGLSYYRIFRSKQTASSFVEMAQVPGTQTTFRDSTVEPLTLYYYTVNAVDFAKNSGPRSEPLSVSTPGLSTPTRVTAIAGKGKITLAWDPNSELQLSGYEVMRYSDPLRPDVFSTFNSVWPAYVDTPLVGGRTYAYRVRALGSGGLNSRLSDFVLATVLDDDLAPAPPEFLYAKLSGNTDIELSWRASRTDEDGTELTGLHQYRIYRSEGSGSAGFKWLATVDSTTLGYVDKDLETSTTYSYHVRAIDASGNEGPASSSVSLQTGPDSRIARPTNVAAVVRNLPEEGTVVVVTWTAPRGITRFRVNRQRVSARSSSAFETVSYQLRDNKYIDTNVESGSTYIYRVVSLRGIDISLPSDPVVVAVP